MDNLARVLILLGVVGIAHLEAFSPNQPGWLDRCIRIGVSLMLLFGLHLYGQAIKRETLAALRESQNAPSPKSPA